MKRTIALILALVMTMALVACGGDKPTSSTPSNPTTSTPGTTNPSTSTPGTDKPAEPTLTKAEQLKKDNADKYGGDMIIGSGGACPTMDPHQDTAGSLYASRPLNHVFESFIMLDANGKFYPQVMDYEFSADGKTMKFTLRDRQFSTGEKITIEDVEASFRRYIAMAYTTQSSYEKSWKGTTVTFEGDTVTFQSADFNINLNMFFGGASLLKIMPKEICEKYAPDWTSGTKDEANGLIWGCTVEKEINEPKDLIGSGPYCVKSWDGDTDIVLVRNENYQIEAEGNEDAIGVAAPRMAYADTITISYNGDASSRTAAMMAGEYDNSDVQAAMWDTALGMGLKQWDAGTTWTHGIFFNLHESNADSPIANVNVRKAIRAVVDSNAALLAAGGGRQERVVLEPYAVRKEATAYQSTMMEDNEYNIHDVAKAKEYLKAAGYNGEPIVYLCHATGNFYNVAMAVIPMLESAGMKVELMAVDNGSHTAMRKDPATGHDIGCWEVQKREDNPVLHSTFVTGTQGWWSSPAKDAAIAVMKTTPTGSAESVAAYHDYLQAVADEVPYILFGHLVGYTWTQGDVMYNCGGATSYYWNHYFVK